MLTKLEIQNYILIDHLSIDLSNQLSVITGETGAGKSIIMGALGLILGDRADSSVCRDASRKCFIEGIFKLTDAKIYSSFFEENEIESNDELIIRREINAQGKSRAFINDTPVTLTILKDLTSKLVDLHQQFDTMALGDTDFQRTVIDALASTQKELVAYQNSFTNWKENEKKLQSLITKKEDFEKTESYKQHLHEELVSLQLQENELENLEQELKFLENAVGIKSQLAASIQILDHSDNPIVQQLKQMGHNLENIVKWQPNFADIVTRLKAAQIEIADIASELNTWQDKIEFDDKKIVTIQERLSLGYNLLKKHKVQTTAELLSIATQLEKDLSEVLNLNDQINELTTLVKKLEKDVISSAAVLTTKREKQMTPLTNNVNKLLHQVGMPNAKIKVTIDEVPYHLFGKDKVDILFDANNTQKFEPIKKVASGGELSRLMLCIKSLVAKSVDLPTMIFDEIDTGISGEPAKQVGLLLQNLGQARQVLCITHQPQIAAKGNAHLYVYKEQKGSTTHTYLKTLDAKERVQHIATMIGGDPPSKSALDNAKELLAS
ncbi:MAG: DNA repair protein RecN [Chitinophagia bacterium]|nr:DNA repair protein RecN [Chitinophagia bacterium]NDD16433.1 DNA repair protein RecN [Chitinophagia bacterium]